MSPCSRLRDFGRWERGAGLCWQNCQRKKWESTTEFWVSTNNWLLRFNHWSTLECCCIQETCAPVFQKQALRTKMTNIWGFTDPSRVSYHFLFGHHFPCWVELEFDLQMAGFSSTSMLVYRRLTIIFSCNVDLRFINPWVVSFKGTILVYVNTVYVRSTSSIEYFVGQPCKINQPGYLHPGLTSYLYLSS